PISNSSHCKWIDCRSTNNHEGWHVGFRDTPTFDHFVFKDIVISGNATQGNRFSIGSAGAAGGRGTNWQIINVNTPLITWRSADDFPSPWNAGWSVTIWKGAFAPTVQANGVQTIEVHDGLPA